MTHEINQLRRMPVKFLDPKIDMAFKKLFGSEDHKQVTISFLNTMLEYTGDRRIESIDFMNNEQLPVYLDKKENILDIFCVDKGKRKFIVEMQNAWMASFEKRIVYYGTKVYANQLSTAKPYSDLDPVTVVAITKKFNVFPKKQNYKSIHTLVDNKTGEHDIDDITFAFIELPKFVKKEHELVTDEDKWLFLLKEIGSYDHVPEPLQKNEFQEACQLLNQLTLSEYEQRVYEKKMLDAQAQDTRDKRFQNAELNEQKAMEQGREQERIEIAKQLLDVLDIETIAQKTGLSLQQVEQLKQGK